MPATLTKSAIDAEATEKRLRELLNQFYGFYFTGSEVETSAGAKTFPECENVFNATAARKPTLPTIHTAILDMKPVPSWEADGVRHYTVKTLLNIWVRMVNRGDTGNKADFNVSAIADGLRWLFMTPLERAALSQKGILHAKVVRGPVAQPLPGYQVRFLAVTADLRFTVPIVAED